MCLYEYTKDLEKLEWNRMFDLFETEEHRRLKAIIHEESNSLDQGDKKVKFADESSRFSQF